MEEHNYTVYMHICPNDKKYIGITKQNPNKRWLNGEGYKTNEYFYKAIKKWGWNNIKHEILFTNFAKEEAEQKEIELIKYYKTNQRKYGYNIENGGHINCVSQTTKEKISKTMKEKETYKNNPNCFKKGHISWIKGKHHSQETIQKILEKRKNQKISSNKVICIETNEIFNSVKEIEEKLNLCAKEIRRVCVGNREKAYGMHWKYINPKKRKKAIYKNSKKVLCVETNKIYSSITEAERDTKIMHIREVCNGKLKSAGKLHWKFYELNEKEEIK